MAAGEPIRIEEGRFDRQELIRWWDQKTLKQARVLVVGAGALSNETLKNLALLGVGNLFIVDLDLIECSNLSRSVLFTEHDVGRSKAVVAAEAVRRIYPDVAVQHLHGNAVYDLGLGVFHWAQIVIGGLDNREARLEISRNCWKTTTPWVDGGIEGLDGQMRLFVPPDDPCYECTMSEADWKLLEARRSCALLSRGEMQAGKVPTTSTVSSVIAGLQCQEAVKWLHGRSEFAGKGLVFKGLTNEFYEVVYQRKKGCYGHEALGELVPLHAGVQDLSLGAILEKARSELGADAALELNRDVLRELECPNCHTRTERLASLGTVTEAQARCPACETERIPHVLHEIDGDCGLLAKTPAEIGVPPFDIVTARCGEKEIALFFDADAPAVLGELAHDN